MNIEKYLLLDSYLDDILTYTMDTLNYLESDDKSKYDISDIVMYLSSVPEIIYEIKKIIKEMELKINEL